MRCSSVFSRVLTARNCDWFFKPSASLGKVRRASIFEKSFKSKKANLGGILLALFRKERASRRKADHHRGQMSKTKFDY
jgi:hypothetical protein